MVVCCKGLRGMLMVVEVACVRECVKVKKDCDSIQTGVIIAWLRGW